MKKINVALMGFGNVGQSFARILIDKKSEIEQQYGVTVNVVAITTKTRGNLVDAWGIDLERVLMHLNENGVFPKMNETILQRNSLDIARDVEYDVLVEMTPLEYSSGHVATEHIMTALNRGKHVICANKGPLAWHYNELQTLADSKNCRFLFETTVLDGTPVFSIFRENLRMCKVTEIKGILNSTTNYVLQGIGNGRELKDVISEGKKRGFIEANPDNDTEGREAAAKMVVLANVMMNAGVTPDDVEIHGIKDITKEAIDKAAADGNVIKLICRAYHKDGKVVVRVCPEEISKYDSYASVSGTSLAISITTDLMGTMTIIEESPEVEQTGYGVFSDLLTIIKDGEQQ